MATLQKQFTKKDVYKYAMNHLIEYFPDISSYQASFEIVINFEYTFSDQVKPFLDFSIRILITSSLGASIIHFTVGYLLKILRDVLDVKSENTVL